MSEELKGTNIAAPVVPFTSEDTYPTHYSLYGKGGFKVVGTALERDSIPQERLVSPTLCYVRDTGLYYEWDGTSWTDKSFGEKGDKGDKGDALEFDILGSYPTLDALKAAYPNGPTDGKNGVFKVGDSLYLWTGDKYEPLNLDIYRTFNLEQFTEVIPSGSTISIDFNKAPYAKVSLSGDNKIFNLVISNVKDGVSGKILVFQTGFKQISVASNIKGTVDIPLNENTIALLTYNVLGNTIYIHSNTVLGDIQFPTPQHISDFHSIYYDSSVCITSWTSPYANNIYDKATEYDMRYSNSPVDADDLSVWAGLHKVTSLPEPAAYGTEQRFTITGLDSNMEYYIYLKSVKVNYGVKYTSKSTAPVYFKTKGGTNSEEGFYRIQITPEMVTLKSELSANGHPVRCMFDEQEKDSFKENGYPDTTNKDFETYWTAKFSKTNNPYHLIIDLNQPHMLDKFFLYTSFKSMFRVFAIKDIGYKPEYVGTSQVFYNAYEIIDFKAIVARFIYVSFDNDMFASAEKDYAVGEELYPTQNQTNLIGNFNRLYIYGRQLSDKPTCIKPPARRLTISRTMDEFFCTNGHFYQQGRIHSMCSGSLVRLYGALGHFGPAKGVGNYQRIADYRVRVNEIPWVSDNNGTRENLRDMLDNSYKKYGLKPFICGTSILDYCKWPGYGPGKDKNKCLDNYWLPGKWIPLPSKGVRGYERYFEETTNHQNYKTLSKTCNHISAVYGKTPVSSSEIDLYDSVSATGLDMVGGIEHINEPDADWEGWMWYMHPDECAAQMSAVYDGHCGTMHDENGNTAKIGVKNVNPIMPVFMPGMAGIHPGYIQSVYLWAKQFRKDGKFPADVLNFHSYFSNIGNQGGDGSIPVQYAITMEESLNNSVGSQFKTIADFRNRYLPDKEIAITEFGYGEAGGRNTQSKYQCYTQPGRTIGTWNIPDRHRSDVKGSWTIRAVLNMLDLGVDIVNYYSTEMEASYFDAGQWAQGAGTEMFHWNDCTDTNPGAKAEAIKPFEHGYARGGFATTGLFGPMLWCGCFPISRAYWWIATFRSRLKGYVYTGRKYIESDKRIMIFCFRKLNESKGAYIVYLNDNQNTGVPNVSIPVPEGLTSAKRVTVYVPELTSPEAIPEKWVEYDQSRTQLPTSRREKYINGEWVIQNQKWAGKYESFSQTIATYPPNPQEGDEITIVPTTKENPYFPIVGPVGYRYSLHGNNIGANQYEYIDASDPVNEDGTDKWTVKYNTALAWRQVDAVCDYIEHTAEGKHGTRGDESDVEIIRNMILSNVSEFPEYYFFDAVPIPDFKSEITDLTAVTVNSTSIKLFWNNHNPEDTDYEVFVSNLPEIEYSPLKTIPVGIENMTLIDGLKPDTVYYFKIRAIKGNVTGELSDYTGVRTYSNIPAPFNLKQTEMTATSITLSWEYSNEILPDFLLYSVYRAGSDGNFIHIANIEDRTVCSFVDTKLSAATNYQYKVRAVGNNGNSDYSPEINARTMMAEECPPSFMYAITDKYGTKITLTFDLPLSPFAMGIKSLFSLTEDHNLRFIEDAKVDESNPCNIMLTINSGTLSNYDKSTDVRISYAPSETQFITSSYGVQMGKFIEKKVSNVIGNFTNIEAIYQINLTGSDEIIPTDENWNNLIGIPEKTEIISEHLKDTYGRVSDINAKSVNNPPKYQWGGIMNDKSSGSIEKIDTKVYKSAWSTNYNALVTENIVARIEFSGLNVAYKYTVKVYSGLKYDASSKLRIKINGVYSNVVESLNNETTYMIIEDCVASSDGILFVDMIPLREVVGSRALLNFIILEEYSSNSSASGNDVLLRDATIIEDNGDGVVTSKEVHVHLNMVGIANSYRISESPEFIEAEWIDLLTDTVDVPHLFQTFGEKTIYVQVRNNYNESNIRTIHIECRDPYIPLALKNIYINNNDDTTNNTSVEVFVEMQGTPTHYRIGETSDLLGAEWHQWESTTSKVTYMLSTGSGQKTVYMQLKDDKGETGIKVDTIMYTSPYVVLNTVEINKGAQKTYDRNIVVNPIYTGLPTHYRVSQEDINMAQWIEFTADATINVTLTGDYGQKTIYMQLKNALGDSEVLSSSIILADIGPIKLIVSFSGSTIPAYESVNGQIVNLINPGRNESLSNTKLVDSIGNAAGEYVVKPSLYPLNTLPTMDGVFSAPEVDDFGAYPAKYYSKYVTGNNKPSLDNPARFIFSGIAIGVYKVRILVSTVQNGSVDENKYTNIFYIANKTESNLSFNVVNNKDNFVEVDNVEVGEDGMLEIKYYNTAGFYYRPGVNLIEIINNNE